VGHPLIDEFCRIQNADGMRTEFFRRCQRVFRDEVQPQLDERERLLVENGDLKAQLDKLSARRAKADAAA
jgi:hypothetical protein